MNQNTNKQANIHIVGSIAYDRIMNFSGNFEDNLLPEKLHMINVCFYIDKIEEKHGGTAANIAYNLYLLGEKSAIYTTVGKDYCGSYQKKLEGMDIDLSHVKILDDELSSCAYITTDAKSNQITAFSPAAMNHPVDKSLYPTCNKGDFAIVAPANILDMKEFPKYFKAHGIRVIYDPGQCVPVFNANEHLEAITGAEIFIGNNYEMELVEQITGATKQEILKKAQYVITTLAENGCEIATKDSSVIIKAPKINTLADPTGAGDSFRAGLMFGLKHGLDIEKSAQIGSICAAYCIEQFGTQIHNYTMDEFIKRYEENYGAWCL